MKPALLAAALAAFVLLRPELAIAADSKPAAGTAAGKEYMSAVTDKVKRTWSPIRSSKTVDIKIGFKVHSDGSVSDVRILEKTTEPINEQRAIAAIKKAAPFVAPPSVLGREPIDIVLNLTCSSILNLTVAQALARYGEEARELLRAQCKSAGVVYPPKRIVLLALKDRKQLLMFAGGNGAAGAGAAGGISGANQRLALVQTFPLVSYSGGLGPKLREGDLQIPEGNYRITGSSARDMLSLAVDYPNAFDRARGLEDHRKKLGGDILIHGGSVSTGCIVVSNEQMQEVFVALDDVGFRNVQLLIAPCDLTKSQPQLNWSKQPKWLPKLYAQLKRDMSGLPIPDTGASK